MTWIKDVFGKEKAIIGLCHLKALPSDPWYDAEGGMEKVIESAYNDILALQEGGIDGIQFTNEFSIPYVMHKPANPAVLSAMAYVIGRLHPYLKVPFGTNCIGDPVSTIGLCAATGAKWTRGTFHGAWATNEGICEGDCSEIYRLRHDLRYDDLKLIHYVVPESAKDLADRDPVVSLKSHYFLNKPDALGLGGLVAGQKVDVALLKRFREAYPKAVLFVVTGVNEKNVKELLSIADAAFVGTSLKKDGIFENSVDVENVKRLMEKVNEL